MGTSYEAQQACYGLELYKKTTQYGDLRRMIANLNWIVSKDGLYNKNACLATQGFALTVFSTLNDYQKAFIATSVTSIYEKAKISIPQDWYNIQKKYGEIISKNLNKELAFNAGLCFININGKIESQPIPQYSENK